MVALPRLNKEHLNVAMGMNLLLNIFEVNRQNGGNMTKNECPLDALDEEDDLIYEYMYDDLP